MTSSSVRWRSQLIYEAPSELQESVELSINQGSAQTTSKDLTLPSLLTYSDKIILPASVLDTLISQSNDSNPLPSPLTFKMESPINGQLTHVGVREFSAPEGYVYLPPVVADKLQLKPGAAVNISLSELPKGSYLQIKPLEAGYHINDWRALFESKLHSSYTTLTKNEILQIDDHTGRVYKFLVSDLKPSDAVCIVDTDVDLDIVPLSDEQAIQGINENKKLEKLKPIPLKVLDQSLGPFRFKENAIRIWELDLILWKDREKSLIVELEFDDISDQTPANFYISTDVFVSDEQFIWSSLGDTSSNEKSVIISGTNAYLDDAKSIYILVESKASSIFSLNLRTKGVSSASNEQQSGQSDTIICSNCQSTVPNRTYQLHYNFCLRHNKLCPLGCKQIFQKKIPSEHWHCEENDGFWGNTISSKSEHYNLYHKQITCKCGEVLPNFVNFALHQATICPKKLHACRFCHLELPQGKATPMDIIQGFTNHESDCSSKTVDCERCSRPIRLRDLKSHMKMHDMDRISKPRPRKCTNEECVNIVSDKDLNITNFGLCRQCFAPSYTTVHDPTGIKLISRFERRYVLQLSRGCGKSWCNNPYCLTSGLFPKSSIGDIIKKVRELLPKPLASNIRLPDEDVIFHFCVDQFITKKKVLVNSLQELGLYYDVQWLCQAVEQVSKNLEGLLILNGDIINKVVSWLEINGVRTDE